MVLDFDINEYCKKLRLEQSPPYKCPVVDCARSYKSLCGLQYHLQNYDHDNPSAANATPVASKQKKGRTRASVPIPLSPSREALTYDEAQKVVQFEIEGKIVRINVADEIPVVTQEELESAGFDCAPEPISEPVVKLPEPTFKQLHDYNICDAPPRPNAYIRFIEKSAEELDGEVEYDVDEEDTSWLSIMNEKREASGLSPVSVDTLELLMDRLEKESYFQAAANGQPSSNVVVDDDAVCCICMDGECQNTNVILFCDMCNLAVHQDCYGVPYIPEGQWLCRRCLQSPSRAVDCVLCPNHGGAFKQTDRGHWAHVVCALWIPEVRFANTVFLEPIDSIETIPPARWKLTCYVCKQRGVGACIQCHKTNCYAAFHVTCAQQAGLYMKMDTVRDGGDSQPVLVQKTAYCDAHTPADSEHKREDSRQRMKQARKILAKKRSTVPVILIPTIPPERIQEIGSLVTIPKKSQFIQRLIAYWTLKRQFRNGVPLLRRLQSAQGGPRDTGCSQNVDTIEMCRQLKYWQCLRQDLERARLLCELVRKREKLKVEYTKAKERCLSVQLKPFESSMRRLLDMIAAKDTQEIFLEPVDLTEVPDYTSVVTNPMDLSTMKMKLDNGQYPTLSSMEKDFDLMIANCLAYNSKDTLFYKAGIKMRDQGIALFKQARQEFQAAGFLIEETPAQSSHSTDEQLATDIDRELESLESQTGVDAITKLEELLVKTQAMKHGVARNRRIKQIRLELARIKRSTASVTDSSQSDMDNEDNKNSPQQAGTSPAGVNRRTAVLFTRKAQAAMKKPDTPTKNVQPSRTQYVHMHEK